MLSAVRARLTYANLVASLALFVALGGTSYAVVALPSNSVGHRQVRAGAIRSAEVKNGSLRTDDLSRSARATLRGARGDVGASGPQGVPGPPAVRYFAALRASGEIVRSSPASNVQVSGGSKGLGVGSYDIGFPEPVTKCAFTATIGSTDATPPPTGRIVVYEENGRVAVKTYNDAGEPSDRPFHVIVAC